jgi:hypothetical protein
MGRRERAEMAVKWIGLGTFLGIGFLEESFEKGNTRKITENRVTSWAFFTLGEFRNLC